MLDFQNCSLDALPGESLAVRQGQASQCRHVFRYAIRRARILVARPHHPPFEQAPDARHDGREHLGHVEIAVR